jgi:hypothetical protein
MKKHPCSMQIAVAHINIPVKGKVFHFAVYGKVAPRKLRKAQTAGHVPLKNLLPAPDKTPLVRDKKVNRNLP